MGRGRIDESTWGDLASLRPTLVLALVALLAVALVGAAVLVGSRLLVPRPAPQTVVHEFVSAPGLSRPMARPVLAPLIDGRVLVIGAGSDGEDQTPTSELYDPATGASEPVGPMVRVGWVDSATPLKDGRVLIIGGEGPTQIFDPETMRFYPVGAMVTPRSDTVTALLDDGRVLVTGGGLRSAELFDPDKLTFSQTGSVAATPAEDATIATLPDGRVLVPAGVQTIPNTEWAIEAEIYDPVTGTFSAAGRTQDFGVAALIVIPDGRVAVVGSSGMGHDGNAALWDPTTGTFSTAGDPPGPVSSAALLDDGRILLIGGVQFPRDPGVCPLRTQRACSWAGIYDPATGATIRITPPTAWHPSATRLADGRTLVVGGLVSGEITAPSGNSAPAVPTVQIFQ